MHVPAVLADDGVHAALWCQRQNQGAVLTLHIYVEAAKARQEHHLTNSTSHMHVTVRKGRGRVFPPNDLYPYTESVCDCVCACVGLRQHMCLSLTSPAPGFQQSAPNVTKGSRSPPNAWLHSHNKPDL